MRRSLRFVCALLAVWTLGGGSAGADDWTFKLRYQRPAAGAEGKFERLEREERWPAQRTAVIVCDVWDYHHCLNAVRRLEEFLPRLDQTLAEARRRGATIIHAPSDCMEAYADHPARRRAMEAPKAKRSPPDVEHWCSRIPGEERSVYPIDQSDGGEDDDPAEHREWAEKLKALGRNPGMPWKRQSERIAIDGERDYISDRGDEVWNILEARGVDRVVLTGVHVNMCVIGRPFGLRQMVRGGKQVVLVRDLTDAMYNPRRWPYVDHFTGNDLVISHIERYVCPTITSDQFTGGEPFRFSGDRRPRRDVMELASAGEPPTGESHWELIAVPREAGDAMQSTAWYRCAVRTPARWMDDGGATLSVAVAPDRLQAWCNGRPAEVRANGEGGSAAVWPQQAFTLDDANLIVIRIAGGAGPDGLRSAPVVSSGARRLTLAGRWQMNRADEPGLSNIPLPARFGIGTDYYFEP